MLSASNFSNKFGPSKLTADTWTWVRTSETALMSISAELQASARSAYRQLLRAASVTFAGEATSQLQSHNAELYLVQAMTGSYMVSL